MGTGLLVNHIIGGRSLKLSGSSTLEPAGGLGGADTVYLKADSRLSLQSSVSPTAPSVMLQGKSFSSVSGIVAVCR